MPDKDTKLMEAGIAAMTPRLLTGGKTWHWTGFADFLLSRLVLCLRGSLLITCLPFKFFETKILKGNWSITQCANALSDMSVEDILQEGGFFRMLCGGQGVVCPPGHICFQAGSGLVGDQLKCPEESTTPVFSKEDGSLIFVTLILVY